MRIFASGSNKRDIEMSVAGGTNEITPRWLGIVAEQVESLKFGVVQITIHESRVVQIEKTEKVRFDKPEKKDAH
jgi:hypothetical protein